MNPGDIVSISRDSQYRGIVVASYSSKMCRVMWPDGQTKLYSNSDLTKHNDLF